MRNPSASRLPIERFNSGLEPEGPRLAERVFRASLPVLLGFILGRGSLKAISPDMGDSLTVVLSFAFM
jgi:hypothetical protein